MRRRSHRVRCVCSAAALVAVVCGIAGEANADDGTTAEAPAEHRGLQLALRTGASIPFGDVSGTTAMSDALSVQVPLIADIGVKPIAPLFLGVYVGTALGGAAGKIETACQQLAVNCVGVAFRAGVLAEYNLRPGSLSNPWFGYGIGYEIGSSSGSNGASSISNSLRGFEFAHLLFGVDFRLQDYFGIGPFLDASLGSYDFAQSKTNAGGFVTTTGGAIDDKALHGWLMLGVRIVLLP